MPRSGTNSQGNHYSTPGGTNSNSGGSYHCKFDPFLTTIPVCEWVVVTISIPRSTPSHLLLLCCCLTCHYPLKIPTRMDPTTTRTTMGVRTTTVEVVTRTTLRPVETRPRATAARNELPTHSSLRAKNGTHCQVLR